MWDLKGVGIDGSGYGGGTGKRRETENHNQDSMWEKNLFSIGGKHSKAKQIKINSSSKNVIMGSESEFNVIFTWHKSLNFDFYKIIHNY